MSQKKPFSYWRTIFRAPRQASAVALCWGATVASGLKRLPSASNNCRTCGAEVEKTKNNNQRGI